MVTEIAKANYISNTVCLWGKEKKKNPVYLYFFEVIALQLQYILVETWKDFFFLLESIYPPNQEDGCLLFSHIWVVPVTENANTDARQQLMPTIL